MEAKQDMERMVQDHEQRLTVLEKNYSDMQQKMQAVETGMHRVEKTLLVEGKEQKDLINQQRKEQDEQRKEQNEMIKEVLVHTLGIKKTNNTKKWELLLALCGGGGIVFLVIELWFSR